MSDSKSKNYDFDDIDGIVCASLYPESEGNDSWLSIMYDNGLFNSIHESAGAIPTSGSDCYAYFQECFEYFEHLKRVKPFEFSCMYGQHLINIDEIFSINATEETSHSNAKIHLHFHGHENPLIAYFDSDQEMQDVLKNLSSRLKSKDHGFVSLLEIDLGQKYHILPEYLLEDNFHVNKYSLANCDILVEPHNIVAITTEQDYQHGNKPVPGTARVVLRGIARDERTHFDIAINVGDDLEFANRLADAISARLPHTTLLCVDPFLAADPACITAYKPSSEKNRKFVSDAFKNKISSPGIEITLSSEDDYTRALSLRASNSKHVAQSLKMIESNQKGFLDNPDLWESPLPRLG